MSGIDPTAAFALLQSQVAACAREFQSIRAEVVAHIALGDEIDVRIDALRKSLVVCRNGADRAFDFHHASDTTVRAVREGIANLEDATELLHRQWRRAGQ
jgi:hypothetical protein